MWSARSQSAIRDGSGASVTGADQRVWHWSQNWSQPPSPSNNVIKAWPDMREYAHVYQTRIRT